MRLPIEGISHGLTDERLGRLCNALILRGDVEPRAEKVIVAAFDLSDVNADELWTRSTPLSIRGTRRRAVGTFLN